MNRRLLNTLVLFFGISLFSFKAFSQCSPTPGIEKVSNGDFESGYTGFTSYEAPQASCNAPCGSALGGDNWAMETNPNYREATYFKSMADHTTGTGKMAIFDFDDNTKLDPIYKTSVTVQPGKPYFFSAWFANIGLGNYTSCASCPGGKYISNSPILKFRVNGVDLNTIHVDSITNNWNQYFAQYTVPGSLSDPTTSMLIEIVNIRGGFIGNDLALDDISFSDGCNAIQNLSSLGQSSALVDTVLICNVSFPYTLNPSLPGTYGYNWKTSGGVSQGTATTYSVASAPSDGTKMYLCYEYIAGCPRKDSVLFRTTPLSVNVGSDQVICAPVSYSITSGISTPPVSIQWQKNGVNISGATSANYTATGTGTYTAVVSRSGCTGSSDAMIITNPTSTFSGSGGFCSTTNTADFLISSGTTKVKWYKNAADVTALNPSDQNASISLPYNSTNTTTPGCASGLYAEDVTTYSGTLMSTAPCATSNSNDAGTFLMVDVSQAVTLNSFDFIFPSGWSTSGSFTFDIYNNDVTKGPSSNGGPAATSLYTVTTPSYSITSTTTYTVATNYTFSTGKYWLRLKSNNGQPFGFFSCSPPYLDNLATHVFKGSSGIQYGSPGSTSTGNITGSGNIFNLKFTTGSTNTCSRLFICGTNLCPSPVNFLSFDVNRNAGGNSLSWKTTTEKNSSYFEIQKSYDGLTFLSVGRLDAAGNSSNVLSYSFFDGSNQESGEDIYYRIEEVDYDGSKTHSVIRSVKNSNENNELEVYPVPVKKGQTLTMEVFSDIENDIVVEIFNNLGQVISTTKCFVKEGNNSYEFSTASLSPGAYYMRIVGQSNKIARLLVE